MAFLDTSILVAYYCFEARSRGVQRLLARMDQPAISLLVEVEFYGAVARKVRMGELDMPAARGILSEFRRDSTEPRFRIVPVQAADYALARQWIEDLSSALRSVDALHLAAASNAGLPVITADRELARSARHFGIRHKLIS